MTDAAPGVAATDGLEALGPEESRRRSVTINSRTIEIRPMVMRQVRQFAPHAKPIAGYFVEKFRGEVLEKDLEAALVDSDFVIRLATEHGETLNRCVSIATDVPFEEIEELPLDVWLELTVKTLAVNLDFFARRLLPAIRALAPALEGVAAPGERQPTAGTGPTP